MRRNTGIAILSFIVFAGMVTALVAYVGSLGIRMGPPEKRTTLSMDVSDVNNIELDSNVLLRGVPVGKVTDIDTSITNATIHFYIDGKYRIPVDSDVRLDNLSALGESYIEFEPRSSGGPTWSDGQSIPADAVKQPPSISELGAGVVRVLNQLDPEQLDRVVHEADVGLPDPGPVLPNLAHASLLLRNTTADLNGQGRKMLGNLQELLENAGFVGPALAAGAVPIKDIGPGFTVTWNDLFMAGFYGPPTSFLPMSALVNRIQKLLDDRGADIKILGEATSANLKLLANAVRNMDSSQMLAHLQATVPEDGVIDLHVVMPEG